MLGWKYSYHVAAFKCGACTTLAVDYSRSNWGLIWTWTWAAQDSFESSAKVKEKLWKVLNHKAYIPPPFSHIFILSHLSQMRHNISELCSDVPDTRKNGQGKPISWVNISLLKVSVAARFLDFSTILSFSFLVSISRLVSCLEIQAKMGVLWHEIVKNYIFHKNLQKHFVFWSTKDYHPTKSRNCNFF